MYASQQDCLVVEYEPSVEELKSTLIEKGDAVRELVMNATDNPEGYDLNRGYTWESIPEGDGSNTYQPNLDLITYYRCLSFVLTDENGLRKSPPSYCVSDYGLVLELKQGWQTPNTPISILLTATDGLIMVSVSQIIEITDYHKRKASAALTCIINTQTRRIIYDINDKRLFGECSAEEEKLKHIIAVLDDIQASIFKKEGVEG